MGDFMLSYREVIPDQTLPEKWKEFALNTGGTQSILQDIKVPERANGYGYKDASGHHTRNRFIYWRINNDVLELAEHSLDVNLSGNQVRFKFTDTPILDGISINEYFGSVVILVPTVCSIHRLVFPHPDKLHKKDEYFGAQPELYVPSIFSNVTQAVVSDPTTFHVVNNPNISNSVLPNVAASFLNAGHEEAVFVFSYPSGELLLVKQAFTGHCVTTELKQETLVPRFLSGIAGAFRGKSNDGHIVVSVTLQSFGPDVYAITLCRDGNLRIWSCGKAQYVAINDIISESSDVGRHLVPGARSHILRKSVDAQESDVLLAVYLSFTSESQFHILRPTIVNGTFRIVRLCTLYSPEQDLVDFSLDAKRLWAVWRGFEGDFTIKSICLDSQNRSDWMPVVQNPALDAEMVASDEGIDPRQAYVSFIFFPGRFPLPVITKALSIYRKTAALSDINVSALVLRERVCVAIETEIQTEVQDYEISDDDYLDIATRCWSRFYSCCVQYHAASTKPLGILVLPAVSGVILIKKAMYSVLRPLDVLEQMFLCPESTAVDQFTSMTHLEISHDPEVCSDLIILMEVLSSLDEQLTDEFKLSIDRDLLQLKSPDKVMSELVIDLITGSENSIVAPTFLWSFSQKLSNCGDLYRAMHLLLEMLRLNPSDSEGDYKKTPSVEYLFSSEVGVSVVSQCLKQMCKIRFAVCRNLLLLQNILLERRELDWDVLEAIRSVCMPETVVFMQAYFVIVWMCGRVTTAASLPETSHHRLSPLHLPPVFGARPKSPMTLLQLYASSTGSSLAHAALGSRRQPLRPDWPCSLPDYVAELGRCVWPVSGGMELSEWLLAAGQTLPLQEYVRLLGEWCEWNSCSRSFVLGAALLGDGEFYKAQDVFLKSAKGIFQEDYLMNKILRNDQEIEARILVNYYLKVIHLFELHGSRDCAINVARTALSVASEEDPHVATLHSVMFVHRLALGHHQEAYNSLVANPDKGRREDNLRDLVKTLLEERRLDDLLMFPYVDMVGTFASIIMARARACDNIYNMYYDFLYSFEVKRGNLRLAATAMYEQAYRLSQHNTVEALEQQVKCYLACINALCLIGDADKWVLRPVDQGEEEEVCQFPVPAGSTTEIIEHKIHRDVKAMDLEGVKREFLLSKARLRLVRYDSVTLTNQFAAPAELVTMLTTVGIYKYALELCDSFKVPYGGVFEELTKMCVTLTRNENADSWNWLVENDLADLPMVDSSPATVSWNLLQSLLDKYEEPNHTALHKEVCQKILSMGAFVPCWLQDSYKKRNASELLRLLLRNGRLTDASRLAVQYIRAALGVGKEYFGLTHSLVVSSPPMCLPLNTIELLLYELGEAAQQNPELKKEREDLDEMYRKYLQTAERVSNDMIQMASGKSV